MAHHYGTRGSSSAPLSDDEWRAICAYADDEVRRIKPSNVGAYRATVLSRRMEEVISDRAMARAFAAQIVDVHVFNPANEPVEEIERNTHRALEALRRGREEGRRERELLAQMTGEQASDPAWR